LGPGPAKGAAGSGFAGSCRSGCRRCSSSVALDARQAPIKREVLAHQPGAKRYVVLPGIERAKRVLRLAISLAAHIEGRDVEASAEGRAAVLARAYPALHLNAVDRRG
nr:hypothetical protein [Tanacetum cinerariifolium]